MNLSRFRSFGRMAAGAALLMLVPAVMRAQPAPLNYAYSYNTSAYNDTATLVEFNIEFSDAGLKYAEDDNGDVLGKLYTRLTFRDEKGGDPRMVDWVTAVPQRASGDAMAMLGAQLVALAPGKYNAQIFYQDINNEKTRDSAGFQLVVPSFAGNRLQLGDVVVVNEASQSDDQKSPFFKHGHIVLPNVSSVVMPPFLVLNTYVEVYNADKVPTSEYHIVYRLADSARNIFYESQVSRPRAGRKVAVELNSIPLDSLPSGQYYVIVKAYNGFARSATDSAMVFRSFHVRNPDFDVIHARRLAAATTVPAGSSIVDPEYAGMKAEELDQEYLKIRPIVTDTEKNIWEGLDGAESKARFFTSFWGARDPSPGTPENESKLEYAKRLEEARNMYSAPMTPRGWDSDRGRVLLKYGKPDGVERHFQEFNRKPYEIWTYTQMNYQFVFIDRTQTGAFTLVHSTAPSEVRNENWEQVATLNNNSIGSPARQTR